VTGGEIIAAGLNVGKAALDEDASTKKQLLAIASETPEMKAAAATYARRVAVKQQIVLKIYQPLARMLGVSREYFNDDFAADLARKTANIPDEDLTTPKPSVAVPAMNGLSLSLEEPSLKEMYLNLLATATDGRRTEDAHPSFADIIRQLSADEAEMLVSVLKYPGGVMPICRILRREKDSVGHAVLQNHMLDWHDTSTNTPLENPMGSVYVDNWIRLGLVEVSYSDWLTKPKSYDWVTARQEMARLRAEHESDTYTVEPANGILRLTDFGKRFGQAVLTDDEEARTFEQGAPD
jgi:hypothetical protein